MVWVWLCVCVHYIHKKFFDCPIAQLNWLEIQFKHLSIKVLCRCEIHLLNLMYSSFVVLKELSRVALSRRRPSAAAPASFKHEIILFIISTQSQFSDKQKSLKKRGREGQTTVLCYYYIAAASVVVVVVVVYFFFVCLRILEKKKTSSEFNEQHASSRTKRKGKSKCKFSILCVCIMKPFRFGWLATKDIIRK